METKAKFIRSVEGLHKLMSEYKYSTLKKGERNYREEFLNLHYSILYKSDSIFYYEQKCLKLEKELSECWNVGSRSGKPNWMFQDPALQVELTRNLDIYFHFIYSFFDQLAKFTRYFYWGDKWFEQYPYRNFKDHIEWVLNNEHAGFDPGYIKILKEKARFIEDARSKRTKLTHNISPIVVPIFIKKFEQERVCFCFDLNKSDRLRGKQISLEEFDDYGFLLVRDYILDLDKNLKSFLESYGEHFLKKLQNE